MRDDNINNADGFMGAKKMIVNKLNESGYAEAILGLSLSYGTDVHRMRVRAESLAHMDKGHNKFLESIYTWWDITAPRYWWQEFDTYRVGEIGRASCRERV